MDFVQQCIQNKKDKLFEWRDRYDKQDYPYKVIQNLFYDLYTDKKMWSEIIKSFETDVLRNQTQQFTDFKEAVDYLMVKRRKIQVEEIRPNLEGLIKSNDPITHSLNFSDLLPVIKNAENGDNKEVESIEYTYVFYELVSDFIFRWASIGLIGKNTHDACYIATEMLSGDANFDSFENAFETFSKIAGLYLAGQNATTGQNFGLYDPISPLW